MDEKNKDIIIDENVKNYMNKSFEYINSSIEHINNSIENISLHSVKQSMVLDQISNNLNNQIFVFNGWTFSSSTTLNPLDHPVYDLWLVSCENV